MAQQVLNASNTSAVFIKTQTSANTPIAVTAADFVPVVGTPKFTPRGPGILRRADIYTPYGGEVSAKTGGIGWDISITTELYWTFGVAYDPTTYPTLLSPLFLACPFKVSNPGTATGDTKFSVQSLYDLALNRGTTAYATCPFTIVYQETGGKKYSAYDCVCIPKFSWEAGGKVMIEWSIKGKWVPVSSTGTALAATITQGTFTPIIGEGCSLSLNQPLTVNTCALSKVSFDPGFALSDVLDARETYGMGVAMIALANSPSIDIEVANLSETAQEDWTDAEANTVDSTAMIVSINVGGDFIKFGLQSPQLVQWPTPGESNGYRNIGLKFAGIVNANSFTDIGYIYFDNTP
jgi:hypothetical protein